MLTPMGTLLNYLLRKKHVGKAAGSKLPRHDDALLAAITAYQDKLTLVHFQSARVALSCEAVTAGWQNLPPPDARQAFEAFLNEWTQLRYDLCFEFVALRIAYDALAKVIVRTFPATAQGKAPKESFRKLLFWFEKHGDQRGAPRHVVDPVCARRSSFLQLRGLRDEFVHWDDDTLIVQMSDGEIGFQVVGNAYPWVPLQNPGRQSAHPLNSTLRRIILDHLELAFEIEALTLNRQSQPVRAPGSVSMLPAALSELYGLDCINTYGVEQFHT